PVIRHIGIGRMRADDAPHLPAGSVFHHPHLGVVLAAAGPGARAQVARVGGVPAVRGLPVLAAARRAEPEPREQDNRRPGYHADRCGNEPVLHPPRLFCRTLIRPRPTVLLRPPDCNNGKPDYFVGLRIRSSNSANSARASATIAFRYSPGSRGPTLAS